jgi:hypothetical protein
MSEFELQLWSGTIGAVGGSVLGMIAAVVVLQMTNHHQKKLSEDERGIQEQQAKKQLEDQERQSERKLKDQRDESRVQRELDAVADLLKVITDLLAEKPDTMAFTTELVRSCDRLTLSSTERVSSRWRDTASFDALGVSRHPLAEALAVAIAVGQIGGPLRRDLAEEHGGEVPRELWTVVGINRVSWNMINATFASVCGTLLSWPHLTDDQKAVAFDAKRDWAVRTAREVAVAADLIRGGDGIRLSPNIIGNEHEGMDTTRAPLRRVVQTPGPTMTEIAIQVRQRFDKAVSVNAAAIPVD